MRINLYVFSLLVFTKNLFFSRFSPNQWEVPPNCQREPEFYENQFTFLNSFWFTLGALVQQGSDVVPIAFCVRSSKMISF